MKRRSSRLTDFMWWIYTRLATLMWWVNDELPWWVSGRPMLEIPPYAFFDALGTGAGNFQGIIKQLPFIKWMGFASIWLTPFMPSGGKDRGYDVTDFRDVDPLYGTLDDLEALIRLAHGLGIRVIMDFVPCHTSIKHPFFLLWQKRHPEYKDFYISSRTGTEGVFYYEDGVRKVTRNILIDDPNPRMVIASDGVETPAECWAYDAIRGEYYWHRFYAEQPALNFRNKKVRKYILETLLWWLREVGIDGFRFDALPFLYMRDGTSSEGLPEVHAWLRKIRRAIKKKFPGVLLLCESDLPNEQLEKYIEEDQCDAVFDFRLRVALMLMLATGKTTPIVELLRARGRLLPGKTRLKHRNNHDDLRAQWEDPWVTKLLRDYYGDGKRGRKYLADAVVGDYAQMLDWDRKLIMLGVLISMMFPGLMLFYYRDILGMGHLSDHDLGGRVLQDDRERGRSPMQWTSGPNAGFSEADPEELYLPLVTEGPGDYRVLNVHDAVNDPGSWLHLQRKINLLCGREHLFGGGIAEPLPLASDGHLGIVSWLEGHNECLINLNNGSDEEARIRTELPLHLAAFRDAEWRVLVDGDSILVEEDGVIVEEVSPVSSVSLEGLTLDVTLPPRTGVALKLTR